MTSPKISNLSFAATNYDELTFRLSDVNVSFVNALRRVILANIPTTIIDARKKDKNTATNTSEIVFDVNTSRFHNEILKHRAGSIPVFGTGNTVHDMEAFCEKYELHVEVTNPTSETIDVTTKDFQVREKVTGRLLCEEERSRHFPPDPITKDYILFARLRPQHGNFEEDLLNDVAIGDGGDGGNGGNGSAAAAAADSLSVFPSDKIKFKASFAIACAHEDASYNVVSTCTFKNTIDDDRVHDEWMLRLEQIHIQANMGEGEIEFARKNFMLLDAGRIFIPNSFDITIQSLGMLSSNEILKMSCEVMISKFHSIEENLKTDYSNLIEDIPPTTIPNAFDIKLVGEDHTTGMVLEYLTHEKYYIIGRRPGEEATEDKVLSYCAFKKFHPHATHSIFRLGFYNETTKEDVVTIMRDVCETARSVFARIHKLFD